LARIEILRNLFENTERHRYEQAQHENQNGPGGLALVRGVDRSAGLGALVFQERSLKRALFRQQFALVSSLAAVSTTSWVWLTTP
jgi:hypothetical protein